MPSDVGLYYPYLHVRNSAWLKLTLLYWDTVRRIVPEDLTPTNDEAYGIKPAVDEGLLLSTSPKQYLGAAAELFRTHVLPRLTTGVLSPKLARVNTDDLAPFQDFDMPRGKIDPALAAQLVELGQAIPAQTHINVPHDVGVAYMLCLATTMSEQTHTEPVTHDQNAADLSATLNFTVAKETGGIPALVRLHIPFPSAQDLHNVPWPKLLTFHKTHAQQRLDFRNEITEITKRIPTTDDPIAITDALRREEQRFTRAIVAHKKAMDRLIASSAPTLLAISIPKSLELLSITHAPTVSIAILEGTAYLGLAIAWWAKYQQERAKLTAEPYQYLIDAQHLIPKTNRKK